MNLRQLEAFRATMRSGSITAAAKLLYVSQPSVSRLISELESSLGFVLFIRTGRGLVASVEARKFQQSVESMFIGMDKLRETAEAIRTTSDDSVSLGVIPIFAHSVMPQAINQLHANRPGVKFDISVRNTPGIVDAVLLQQLDLGVICPTRQYEGIHIVFQTTVPYMCLLPSNHDLAASDEAIDIHQLNDEEFVTLGPAYFDQVTDDQLLLQKLRKNNRIVAHSDPAIASIARASGLLAIVDVYSARIAVALGGVEARPLLQKLEYPIAIITRSTDTLSITSSALADALVDELGKMA